MDETNKQRALIVASILVGFMMYSYIANQPTGERVTTLEGKDAEPRHDLDVGSPEGDNYQPASKSGSGETPRQYANGTAP